MKQVVFIFSDVKTTLFMQRFGVFESSKVVLAPTTVGSVPDDWGQEKLDETRSKLVGQPYRLIGCATKDLFWTDEAVQFVSDKERVYLLKDYLTFARNREC